MTLDAKKKLYYEHFQDRMLERFGLATTPELWEEIGKTGKAMLLLREDKQHSWYVRQYGKHVIYFVKHKDVGVGTVMGEAMFMRKYAKLLKKPTITFNIGDKVRELVASTDLMYIAGDRDAILNRVFREKGYQKY